MTDKVRNLKIFLSHNTRDKPVVRQLAALIRLVGGDVWLDEWELEPGDSIPGGVNSAIEGAQVLALVWSRQSSQSKWVAAEWETALSRQLSAQDSCRVVPLVLDDTPLPAMLARFVWIDVNELGCRESVRRLLNFDSEKLMNAAMQRMMLESGMVLEEYWGVGQLFCCPRCGAGRDRLNPREWFDESRDDVYRGVECLDCSWADASDV